MMNELKYIIFLIFYLPMFKITITTNENYIQKCCKNTQYLNSQLDKCGNYSEVYLKNDKIKFKKEFFNLKENNHWISSTINISTFDESMPQLEYGGFPSCGENDKIIKRIANDVLTVFENGSILIKNEIIEKNVTIPSKSYCIERLILDEENYDNNNFEYIIIICPCLTMPCVRMCCQPNEYLGFNEQNQMQCISGDLESFEWHHKQKDVEYMSLHNIQECTHGYYLLNKLNKTVKEKEFEIDENGNLKIEDAKSIIKIDEYCLHKSKLNDTFYKSNVLICQHASEAEGNLKFRDILYGSYFIICAVFLAFTLAIYSFIPELRKSTHSKNLLSHTASLFVAYSTLAITQFYSHLYPKYICVIAAFLIQFSFIAAFLWLNVMCIDIAWTFSGYNGGSANHRFERNNTFLIYSIYAWSVTFGISGLTAFVEYADMFNTRFKPGFGTRTCWFKDSYSLALFFYVPIGVILLLNLILFTFTVIRIRKLQRDAKGIKNSDSGRFKGNKDSSTKEKRRLILYAKLLCLMGITWVFEIVSWAIGGPPYYWYLTDAINSLRGVFIFIIFCCKRKVFILLTKELAFLKCFVQDSAEISGLTEFSSTKPPPLRVNSFPLK